MSGELYLCLYARDLPLQALMRINTGLLASPIAVMDGESPFQLVRSINENARRLGVAIAMGRAEMDSFPLVTLLKRSLADEQEAKEVLLKCASQYSPRIETIITEDEFGLVLDIAGNGALFGPPERLAVRLQNDLKPTGIDCSIVVSHNFHTSVCMARVVCTKNTPLVIPFGHEQQLLASLPLHALTISTEHAESLEQWGIATLGDLAILPENDLIVRFGQEGQRLRTLSRGEHPHLFIPMEQSAVLEEIIELESPVEVIDSLLFGVNLMLERLIANARARLLSLSRITSELSIENGGLHIRTICTVSPTSDRQVWLKLLHLDWVMHPPLAPVIALRLIAETDSTRGLQLGLFSPQLPEPGRLSETLAKIYAVVGETHAGSIVLKDTYAPDSFELKAFAATCHSKPSQTEPIHPFLSMRRLRPPERISVAIANHSPYSFYFRGITYRISSAYGPWCASGGWWLDNQWSIEIWDVIASAVRNTFGSCASQMLHCSLTMETSSGQWKIESMYD
jgi:protein ImuB